ncbi:MAG: FAD-binding oxidoreductase, partial [Patescibacteria group bacterium]
MKYEVFWKNPNYKVRPELKKDIRCDYLVVGGGITGVSAAYALAKGGAKNIVLIEKNHIGSGATGKAAGTLVTRGEQDLRDLIQKFGRKKAKQLWQELHNVINTLRNIIDKEKIDCEAEMQDTLYCGFKKNNQYDVRPEYEAEKSIESTTRFLEGDALKKEINSDFFAHGMLSRHHGLALNPLKFIQGFSLVIEKDGVKIYEQTALTRLHDHVAHTHHGDITFKKIIWAVDVDYPEDEIKNLKTTIIVTRPLTPKEIKQIGFAYRKKIVWDNRKKENYFKVTHDNRILVGFGNILVHKKHKKTDPHFPHLQQLKDFLKKLFPYLKLEAEYAWSGNFGVNRNRLRGPLVRVRDNEAIIAGCGSQVVCFIAAKYIADKLLGKKSKL